MAGDYYFDPVSGQMLEAVGYNPSNARMDIVGYEEDETGALIPTNSQARRVISAAPWARLAPQSARAHVPGAPRPAPAMVSAVPQAQQQIALAGGKVVPSVGGPPGMLVYETGAPNFVKMRRQLAPLSPISIPAGATVNRTIAPQRPFRVDCMILRASAADAIFITAFSIGQETQFVVPGSMAIELFSADAVNNWLRSNTSTPGTSISIDLNNSSAAAVTVSGVLIGETVDG